MDKEIDEAIAREQEITRIIAILDGIRLSPIERKLALRDLMPSRKTKTKTNQNNGGGLDVRSRK